MWTEGNMTGIDDEASTASTSGPRSNQTSSARVTSVATQQNGTGSSSKVVTVSARHRNAWMLRPWSTDSLRRASASVGRRPRGTIDRASVVRHRWSIRSTPRGVGSPAIAAPLIAPIEQPTIRSGRTPWSSRARSIPTWDEPRLAPLERTKAVVTRR
jgi:hypothetical protein